MESAKEQGAEAELQTLEIEGVFPADHSRLKAMIEAIVRDHMREGEHFGKIPGSKKRALWKSGAEILCRTFSLSPNPEIIESERTAERVRFIVRVRLFHVVTGQDFGAALGACSSDEERHKWRRAFGKEYDEAPAERRRTVERLKDKQRHSEKQVQRDPGDLENTVLRIAEKRAFVAITRTALAASDMFEGGDDDADGKDPKAGKAGSDRGAGAGGIQTAQRRTIEKHVETLGLSADGLREILFSAVGKERIEDLTAADARKVIPLLQRDIRERRDAAKSPQEARTPGGPGERPRGESKTQSDAKSSGTQGELLGGGG